MFIPLFVIARKNVSFTAPVRNEKSYYPVDDRQITEFSLQAKN